VPYPELSVCDGFDDYRRVLLLSLKLTGKLNRTELPGPKLSINGTDAAWKATVCINLENAAQVVFSRLASILDAVQLANSTAKLGQRLMSGRLADAHVFMDSIRRNAIQGRA
jgi:hypothetical protein